jgi:uncharacterized membrane protein
MEVCMIEKNNYNSYTGQTISCPGKKLSMYHFLLALCGALFCLTMASAAWSAEITYPVSTFSDGKARFYEYKAPDGIVIKYFILKSSDGVIRAAFDACDVCWEAGKGYTQKDDFMICKNCGRRFHSNKINEVSGGCNPAPLVRKIQDGKVVIDTQNILTGKRYFDFRGKRG